MSNEPNLKWFHVVPNLPDTEITDFSFGSIPQVDVEMQSDTVSIKVTNDNEASTAYGPILYLEGEDAEKLTEEKWVYIKNTTYSGEPVEDIYTAVSNSNQIGYKVLAGDIEPGTYIEFDVYLAIPPETDVDEYEVSYKIEYQYSL